MSPASGKPDLFLACTAARGNEFFCGHEAKHFEPREPEKPKLSPLQEKVQKCLIEGDTAWEIMQALEGVVELPEELSDEDIKFFDHNSFRTHTLSNDRCSVTEIVADWLKWRREK